MRKNIFSKKKVLFAVLLSALFFPERLCAAEYTPLFSSGADADEVNECIKTGKKTHSTAELCTVLKNSARYRAYIRKRLKEENMPQCIEYLPLIESNYKPTAKPADGQSMGIWQFMPNSVFPYMELSEYVDERRDPWISTDSALKKLKENFGLFKDWLLALAAYNCGAGSVSRALEKASEKNFLTLCRENLIPFHAQRYVPNFLKMADLVENAPYYNEEKIQNAAKIRTASIPEGTDGADEDFDPAFFYYDFDFIFVPENTSLEILAAEVRLDSGILQELNLSLVTGRTPPGRSYRLRIPGGMQHSFEHALFVINKRKKNAEK